MSPSPTAYEQWVLLLFSNFQHMKRILIEDQDLEALSKLGLAYMSILVFHGNMFLMNKIGSTCSASIWGLPWKSQKDFRFWYVLADAQVISVLTFFTLYIFTQLSICLAKWGLSENLQYKKCQNGNYLCTRVFLKTLFQTERTRWSACLLSFCELVF